MLRPKEQIYLVGALDQQWESIQRLGVLMLILCWACVDWNPTGGSSLVRGSVRARALALPVHHTTVGLPCNYVAACSRPPIGAYICTGGNLLVGGFSRYHVECGVVIRL